MTLTEAQAILADNDRNPGKYQTRPTRRSGELTDEQKASYNTYRTAQLIVTLAQIEAGTHGWYGPQWQHNPEAVAKVEALKAELAERDPQAAETAEPVIEEAFAAEVEELFEAVATKVEATPKPAKVNLGLAGKIANLKLTEAERATYRAIVSDMHANSKLIKRLNLSKRDQVIAVALLGNEKAARGIL